MVIVPTANGVTWVSKAEQEKATRGLVAESVEQNAQADAAERARPAPLSFHLDSGTASPAPSTVPSLEQGSDGGTPRSNNFEKRMSEIPGRKCSFINYPASPAHVLPRKSQPAGVTPRMGIDIGGVLTRDGDPFATQRDEWDEDWEAPGAFDAVARIAEVFGTDNVYLVSKVKPGGSMQKRAEHWLHEIMGFCEWTGVPRENIVFVSATNGANGKGPAAARLGLSHFIDDKLECLTSVHHDEAGNSGAMIERFKGLLFHFAKGGCGGPPDCDLNEVPPMMRRFYSAVSSWNEVLKQLHERLPMNLKQKGDILVEPREAKKPKRQPAADLFEQRLRMGTPPWQKRPSSMLPQAVSPTASRVRSAAPALQPSDGGRPRLNLKPRDPNLGSVGQQSANEASQVLSPTANRGRSQPALQASADGGRPRLQLKPRDPRIGQAPEVAQTVVVGPALQPDPDGGRPRLLLKKRDEPQQQLIPQAAPPVAAPALRPDPEGGRPRLQLKKREEPRQEPAQALPAQPALQPDPAGGRPKLQLKKRGEQTQEVARPVLVTSPRRSVVSPTASATFQIQRAISPEPVSRPPQPALQKDPGGGRPRLMLKPRSNS